MQEEVIWHFAFLHRVSLPKQVVDNGDKRITIPWRCPDKLEAKVEDGEDYEFEGTPLRPVSENEDVASLVFMYVLEVMGYVY